jgi:dynein light chain roadblock-type
LIKTGLNQSIFFFVIKGLIIIDSEGIPIRTSMDNETTLHYAALISQLTIHAKRVVRELDPSQELEQLRKNKR